MVPTRETLVDFNVLIQSNSCARHPSQPVSTS